MPCKNLPSMNSGVREALQMWGGAHGVRDTLVGFREVRFMHFIW